ncbi:gamma-butyrobetaine hydroxylase-like domain-containing protein [Ideonella sp. YS5]|uniref:gamma-butyrobetaine hydroxylase-like domain-containing protein n=1 Tax=Ideonella sp. YS5 TaxID=3453714 RepID=UPI003EED6088
MEDTTPTGITDHRLTGLLEITWADGLTSRLRHSLLREHCRCAGCEQLRRHGDGVLAAGEALRLVRIEPVGEHGLNLGFSDGHDRGIYPWTYLRQLGAL